MGALKVHRLWVRLLGSHVLLVVILAIAMGLLIVRTSQEVLQAAVLQGHREVVRRTAKEIFYFINQPVSNLRALALAMNVERGDWQRQSLLSQGGLEGRAVSEICLVDKEGSIRATSILDVDAALSRGHRLPAGYLPDEEGLWRTISKQGVYFSDLLVKEGSPSLIVGVPVKEGARVVGALMARLNLYGLWEKIDQLSAGETGHSSLIDQQGRFIAHPAREQIYRQQVHPQAEYLLSHGTGTLEWKDEQDKEWVAGFAPVEELNWVVVTEQQADEAFGFASALQQRIYLIVGFSVVGAILLGLLLLRTITRPLNLLMKAVQGMQRGQLQNPTLPKRKDELRELGEAFVEMSQMLDARQKELESSLAFEKHLIEGNPLGIAVIDGNFRIAQVNRAWTGIFHRVELIGQPLSHTPEGAQLETWLREHPGQYEVNDFQISGNRGDTRFWNLKVVELAEGYPGKILLVLEDKTAQRSLELQLIRAEKLASLGEMAAGVAHEIKNPLSIMQNACDLLKRLGPDEKGEQERTLQSLERAIRRVDERVGELLDFARPSGHPREALEVNVLVKQFLGLERRHLEQRGIRLNEKLGSVPPVYMNRDVFKDILLNLITNALGAMPEGGELSVSTYEEAGQVVLQIRDTGVGVPADHLPHIFDPFFSTKPPGQGTGLGLSIVHRQVREAGGQVQVTSKEGQGASFAICLPAVREKGEPS
ncbi:MAG: HAMP domain-containing protein [Candidatus Latescibacteria bacterium]|nr:HAMP domain-containing protein [Candidatus Latescibacterota bacterium]